MEAVNDIILSMIANLLPISHFGSMTMDGHPIEDQVKTAMLFLLKNSIIAKAEKCLMC